MSTEQLRTCDLGRYVLDWICVHEDALAGPVLVTGTPEDITLSQLDGWQRRFTSKLLAALS